MVEREFHVEYLNEEVDLTFLAKALVDQFLKQQQGASSQAGNSVKANRTCTWRIAKRSLHRDSADAPEKSGPPSQAS